ncbi:sigma-70 family RNA polymerase sigma factor [Rhodopirellula sallentina]|uniref:RNA polymerase, sigma-24 subunit, ECF subfamily n=1 Tax=Rhodopirellula sallentina SM41 TaxID=1263870 RepID=M5UHQ2_9BACT|nr:sigma-70 family RNA polymerase sigma factor [Rhodopirellula sallentina]EMI55558.1 RNA polymerase, sigma-24 subunit, ECF subfamily [Rhodopirellula sallentina SM41]
MPSSSMSQQQLVSQLFLKHSPRIRGFILSMQPDMLRAEDVLQETFMTVSAKAEDFEEGTNFVAWACRIARFKLLEERRKDVRSPTQLSPEAIEALCATDMALSDEHLDDALLALSECLPKLAPRARRAIELRYSRAHSPAEIARILGWTASSVYVALSRARNLLEKCISSQLNASGGVN